MSWEQEKSNFGSVVTVGMYKSGMIRSWYRHKADGWKLLSGVWSPTYIQLRPVSSYPELYETIAAGMSRLVREEAPDVNRLVGVAMAGIPLSSAVTLKTGIPSCWTRKTESKTIDDLQKEIEKYGQHSLVEGEIESGDTLGLVDDLTTKFTSKLLARELVNAEVKKRNAGGAKLENVNVKYAITLFDREQGGAEEAAKNGMVLVSLIPFASKGLDYLQSAMGKYEFATIVDYFKDPQKYQNPELQAELKERALQAQGK